MILSSAAETLEAVQSDAIGSAAKDAPEALAAAAPLPPLPVPPPVAAEPSPTPTPPPAAPIPSAAPVAADPVPSSAASRTDASAASSASIVVGTRVWTEFGDEGVVRFVGPTSFREGEWVGVELLRPKGKNDGTVKGVRYFTCQPEHGLFARAPKLLREPPPPDSVESSLPPDVLRSARSSSEAVALSNGAGTLAARNGVSSPGGTSARRSGTWPAPELRPTLRGMPTSSPDRLRDRAASMDYAVEYSPWPERQVPSGWRRAWGAPLGESSAADDSDAIEPWMLNAALPVVIYVSSLNGDRRTNKMCRWTIDFLYGKKVPHSVVDLSVHPQERQRLEAHMNSASPGKPPTSRRSDDEMNTHLPVIDIIGLRSLSSGEMQDLEDHGELDPILTQAIRTFASRA